MKTELAIRVEVIDFIQENFELGKSTSGFEKVYLGFEKKVN